jgi:hypothetical protein
MPSRTFAVKGRNMSNILENETYLYHKKKIYDMKNNSGSKYGIKISEV